MTSRLWLAGYLRGSRPVRPEVAAAPGRAGAAPTNRRGEGEQPWSGFAAGSFGRMSDLDALRGLLLDSFTRVHELVEQLSEGMSEEAATFRPDAEANTAAWLLWHLTRIQDDHLADLAGVGQAWPAWRARFGLPFDADATGYGHSATEVGQVRVGGELLAGYHRAVHALTDIFSAPDIDRKPLCTQ